jgi:hypothetical protein
MRARKFSLDLDALQRRKKKKRGEPEQPKPDPKAKPKPKPKLAWILIGSGGGLVLLVVLCYLLFGPSYRGSPPKNAAEQNLQKFGRLYSQYRNKFHKVPASNDALRQWARGVPHDELRKWGIEDVDKVCISPRDNQPYEIVQPPTGATGIRRGAMVAHERSGSGGTRCVLLYTNEVVSLGQGDFEEMQKSVQGAGPDEKKG